MKQKKQVRSKCFLFVQDIGKRVPICLVISLVRNGRGSQEMSSLSHLHIEFAASWDFYLLRR